MRSVRWFFVAGVLMLVLAGVFVNTWFSGILLAGGLGALVGSINAFVEGGRNGK